jgi:hypothetical protein
MKLNFSFNVWDIKSATFLSHLRPISERGKFRKLNQICVYTSDGLPVYRLVYRPISFLQFGSFTVIKLEYTILYDSNEYFEVHKLPAASGLISEERENPKRYKRPHNEVFNKEEIQFFISFLFSGKNV